MEHEEEMISTKKKKKKKKTTSGRKQSFLREEVAFLYACLLIKSRFRE